MRFKVMSGFILSGVLSLANAQGCSIAEKERAITCAAEAADRHSVDVLLLWAIKRNESGASACGKVELVNEDGSIDRGPMQVNSQWLPRLQAKGINIKPDDLYDWCVSFEVGAWILADSIKRNGLAEGVARYHSPTAWRGARYVRGVLSQLDAMSKNRAKRASPL